MSTAHCCVRLLLPLIAFGALTACEATTGPKTERRLGVFEYYGEPVKANVPDTMLVSTPAMVSITTYGSPCFSKGETETTVTRMSVLVLPYDYYNGGNCPDVLREFEHTATLVFEHSGTATVTFVGRREPGDSIVTVERTLTVK